MNTAVSNPAKGYELHDCVGEEEPVAALESEDLLHEEETIDVSQEQEPLESISTEDPGPEYNEADSERREHCTMWEKGIADYPNLEGNVKFLDEFEVFCNKYSENTSTLFDPYLGKF